MGSIVHEACHAMGDFDDVYRFNQSGVGASIVFENDGGVIEHVRSNTGIIGAVKSPEAPSGVKTLPIDGVQATDGEYPGTRGIFLVYRGDNAKAADFTAFLLSDTAADVFAANGIFRNYSKPN